MDNIGNHILTSQGNQFQIDQLLSQRKLYTYAKRLQLILILITVLVPVVLVYIIKSIPEMEIEKNWLFALYSVVAFFLECFIEIKIAKYKKTAASIQEKFDIHVLKIEENEMLLTSIVGPEIIRDLSLKLRSDNKAVEKVLNWYSLNISEIKSNLATLLCQRTNINYDLRLRKKYYIIIISLLVIPFVSLLAIFLFNNVGLKDIVIEVFLPCIPIFVFTWKELYTNYESINELEHISMLIDEKFKSLTSDSTLENVFLRKIQDRIFINRTANPLIPDWFYNLIRSKSEDTMNYSVIQKTADLSN